MQTAFLWSDGGVYWHLREDIYLYVIITFQNGITTVINLTKSRGMVGTRLVFAHSSKIWSLRKLVEEQTCSTWPNVHMEKAIDRSIIR